MIMPHRQCAQIQCPREPVQMVLKNTNFRCFSVITMKREDRYPSCDCDCDCDGACVVLDGHLCSSGCASFFFSLIPLPWSPKEGVRRIATCANILFLKFSFEKKKSNQIKSNQIKIMVEGSESSTYALLVAYHISCP
ncbi:hypothetical protein POVWA2_025850 [Plasmodium ovale wallikeri]|uniref:Uncharacterized protein n=1 Tax=Plasmodium ovale wallikeri TaxID=864142 RepID=A0A1A8YVG0_PLAOA|nr:hypothetical protein POVWA1_026020 [Plasmodium ovale wallikeri]SBT35612.1 hypothetical protein POVWA2_025850 [Plasmodium ovale wallikeri]